MSQWSRRDVLAALGAGAAAPALGPLLTACGASSRPRPRQGGRGAGPAIARLRPQLREIASALERQFDEVYAAAQIDRTSLATLDASEESLERIDALRVHLAGRRGDRWRQIVVGTTDPDRVAAAALQLLDSRSALPRGAASRRRLIEIDATATVDPASLPLASWPERVRELLARADRAGGSHIVYRGAYLEVRDRMNLYIDGDREIAERQLRSRAGVALAAWTGEAVVAETAERAGAIGLEVLELDESAIDAAARRALALLTARAAPVGALDLVLAPEVAGLLCHRCVAAPLLADAWLEGGVRAASLVGNKLGSDAFTLDDDATATLRYGSYAHDDEGWPSESARLFDGGVLRGPLTDRDSAAALAMPRTGHGRRHQLGARATPQLSHLRLAPGTASQAELVAEVQQGALVEGPIDAAIDPRDWRMLVRARSAQEIVDGRLTGRRFGGILLGGDVPAWLASVRGVGSESAIGRVDTGGAPSSFESPAVLSRGTLLGGPA